MSDITLDAELKLKLKGLEQGVVLRNEDGEAVAMVLPMSEYKSLLEHMKIPLGDKEIDERGQEKDGISLQDFWRRM